MSEETSEVPTPLPLEQRIAAAVVHDSIVKVEEEDKLDKGHCSVELLLNNQLPEHTPHDFSPSNDLEEFLSNNPGATSLTLTLPFSFKLIQLGKGIGANIVRLEREYDCEVNVSMRSQDNYVQAELISNKLQRSLYMKMIPHPDS